MVHRVFAFGVFEFFLKSKSKEVAFGLLITLWMAESTKVKSPLFQVTEDAIVQVARLDFIN